MRGVGGSRGREGTESTKWDTTTTKKEVESQPRRRRGHGSVVKSSPVWCEWGDKGREEGEDRVTRRSGDTTKWRHDNEEEQGQDEVGDAGMTFTEAETAGLSHSFS